MESRADDDGCEKCGAGTRVCVCVCGLNWNGDGQGLGFKIDVRGVISPHD